MKRLWSYILPYRFALLGALCLGAVNQIFSLLDPQIFRLIIDNYASRAFELSRDEFVRGVSLLLLGSIGVTMVSRIAKNFQDYFVNVITQRVGADLYSHSVSHSLSLPYQTFEDQRSGELLQTLHKARLDTQVLIVSVINTVFLSMVGIVFVLTYALFVHWSVALLYTLIIPTLALTTFLISRRIKAAQQLIVKEQAGLAGSTTETLRNVELVKSLGLESQEIKRLNFVNDKILRLDLQKLKLVRILSFIQGTVVNALRSLLLLLMLWLIFEQYITVGEFFSLLFYSFFIFNPLSELGTVATQYQEARASYERLEEILKIEPEPLPENPKVIQQLDSVDFENVSYGYQSGERHALQELSLSIKAGQTVAFVGPSGSGKSTLIKMLVGLYQPLTGSLKFNGIDSRSIDYSGLRNRIGFVAQDTQLFAGTIRENLLFVKPSATDDDCLRVLKLAAASTIIERGDKGLDTKIGEGGLKLSGGERQRLAIARALLREPALIIFDEATSSLDSLTEQSITETIKDIEKTHPHLITILIAHRLSTIAHADIIYVLERGKIIESGTHTELLKSGNLYAALWRQQIAAE
jgi:ATP-binding cassette subfamily B protein